MPSGKQCIEAICHAVNQKRLNDLSTAVKVLKRTENALDAEQVLTVAERYSTAPDLPDSYDYQTLQHPKGNSAAYRLTYEERRLDERVHKKAIQKAAESYRVTDEHKKYLKSLR